MIKLVALFVVLVVAINADDNVKCYVCNELADPKCADPYAAPASHVVACDSDYSFCRKTVQSVDGVKSIVRQCGKAAFKNNQTGCYKTAGKSTQHVCTCIGDKCNSGAFLTSSLMLVTATALFKFLF